MTNEKVVVTKEVAEAISALKNTGSSNFSIVHQAYGAVINPVYLTIQKWAFKGGGGSPDLLLRALVNGYEVEKSPEEQIREYYVRNSDEYASTLYTSNLFEGRRQGTVATLDILGIKIEGVNE